VALTINQFSKLLQLSPGIAVGAGGAFTVGEKLLTPPRVTPFSVGDGGVALVLVGVGVGVSFSLELHAVASPLILTVATTKAIADRRRIPFMLLPDTR